MVLSFVKELSLSCQVLCERLVHLPIHWLGRSVLCSGADCPACAYRSPRLVYYAGVAWQRQRRVVECPSSFAAVIDEACRSCGVDNPMGICLSLKRQSKRDTWKVAACERRPLICDPMPEQQIGREVALCLKLQAPLPVETWREWMERVRVSQALILRNCCLNF